MNRTIFSRLPISTSFQAELHLDKPSDDMVSHMSAPLASSGL